MRSQVTMTHGGDVWQGGRPGDWLDFSANLRPEGPPEWVCAAMRAALEEAAFYPDPTMAAARRGLSEYLELDLECVLPTAGGISAIDLVSGLPASDVLLPEPCFGEYEALAAVKNTRVRRVSLLNADGVGGLADTLAGGSLVWLCNPMNPTGRTFDASEIGALLDAVEAAHGWLAVDEAFIGYCPERSVRRWVASRERLIVVGSLTKLLGIPGVRLGYVCAQPSVLKDMRKRQLTWELNCFAASVARALPDNRRELLNEAEVNRRRRERLRAELEALGARVYPSGAPFLLASFPCPVAPIAEKLREKRILVRQCLDFPGIDDGRHLRLAVKTEAANERLIKALKEALACGENH